MHKYWAFVVKYFTIHASAQQVLALTRARIFDDILNLIGDGKKVWYDYDIIFGEILFQQFDLQNIIAICKNAQTGCNLVERSRSFLKSQNDDVQYLGGKSDLLSKCNIFVHNGDKEWAIIDIFSLLCLSLRIRVLNIIKSSRASLFYKQIPKLDYEKL